MQRYSCHKVHHKQDNSMTQYHLIPLLSPIKPDTLDAYRPETEREIFERLAATMRDEQRRERRRRLAARLRRIFGGGHDHVAPGSRRVARNH
jgi:hypothetical protein